MIQTETTPNPESLKFLSENTISAIGTEEFQKNEINKVTNPFIKELLGFKGVELVLLSKNFLSVKKTKDISWNELKPMVISHLNHYFENNKSPILKEMSGKEYSFVKNKLADLLVNEICPVGKKINELMNDKRYLLEILKKGTEKARIKAEENLKNIREKVGLI